METKKHFIDNRSKKKRSKKRCFIRLSRDSKNNWFALEDLYLLIKNNGKNPQTGENFTESEIQKIKSLYESYDVNYFDLNDIPSKSEDIEPLCHSIDSLENLIEDQNLKIEENYSQIVYLLNEIEILKEKHLSTRI